MGKTTDAHCFHCGYDTGIFLGGVRSNFTTFAAWPVHCPACEAITTANFLEAPLTCTKCGNGGVVPVSDPTVWRGDGEQIEEWFTGGKPLVLTDGHYRCPKCGAFELRFGTNTSGRHSQRFID